MKKNSESPPKKKTLSPRKTKLYVIVPLLNEEANVERLMESWRRLENELPAYKFSYIIVDDGSTDATGALARRCLEKREGVVLSHETNRGPGYAFGTAFEHLSSRITPSDKIMTIEGDNTSRDELVPIMLARLEREGFDAILASPYAYGGGIENTGGLRVFLSHGANAFVKVFLGIHGIHTMSSFFRLYTGNVIMKLQERFGPRIVQRAGFESMIELLKKLILANARISEIAMKLDTSRRVGVSKMKVLRTIRGYFSLYAEMRRWT